MDITKVDSDYIEMFAFAYSVATEVFCVAPAHAVPKKQKQIRKWIQKNYIDNGEFPEKVMNYIDMSKSDSEVLELMEECYNYVKEHGTLKKQFLEKTLEDFSDNVKKAFLHLFEEMLFSDDVERTDGKMVFTLNETFSYKWSLILYTGDSCLDERFDELCFADAKIEKDGEGYRLFCLKEDYKQGAEVPVNIFFKKAETKVEIFRADCRTFAGTPWDTLAFTAIEILDKSYLGDEYLNQKEKDLVPLLKELRSLINGVPPCENQTQTEYIFLRRYFEDYGLNNVTALLDEIAENYMNPAKRGPLIICLNNRLNESKSEPLWRKLSMLLSDSQEGYAERQAFGDEVMLKRIRTRIEKQLHSLGYEGEYPVFCKNGVMKGIRLEESYDFSYFLGAEKNVRYIIQCIEDSTFGRLQIQFLCGTALLKKDEEISDIYSCCFNAKGRRLFKDVYYQSEESESLEQIVTIAAKKAECVRLNKEEKQIFYGKSVFGWRQFLTKLIFTGGLFATAMLVAMVLFCSIFTAVTVGTDEVRAVLQQMPFGALFALAFIGFGGAMAIIDLIVKTK